MSGNLRTSLKPASQTKGMKKKTPFSFFLFYLIQYLIIDNTLHVCQVSKARWFQTDLQTNSIVEILLQEMLSQLFPIVHAKGAVKCFWMKEARGKKCFLSVL